MIPRRLVVHDGATRTSVNFGWSTEFSTATHLFTLEEAADRGKAVSVMISE